jgi:predicted nucleic acid-binding Zn finger protein
LARDNGIDSVKKLGYSQIINFWLLIGKGKEYFLTGTKFCYIVEIADLM